LKNHEDLAKQLRDNFNAFRDPKNPGFISVDSIHAMANRGRSSNPAENENIRLAKELLRRPDLMSALDRHSSNGSQDGLIDRHNLNLVIKGDNYFKYKTDKELVGEMLEHFNALKGGPWGQDINIKDLRKLAAKPLSGDSAKDHLIQLAQEVLKRSDLLKLMDNLVSPDNDGRISREALRRLAR
jgi:DNA replicative helicase MCM subunit Mcm2 (Cdc46/Mcm family)